MKTFGLLAVSCWLLAAACCAGQPSHIETSGVDFKPVSPTALHTPDEGVVLCYDGQFFQVKGSDTVTPLVPASSPSTNALNSATTVVNVSNATAPTTGEVLTATDASDATWQAPPPGCDYTGATPMATVQIQKFENGIILQGATPYIEDNGANLIFDMSDDVMYGASGNRVAQFGTNLTLDRGVVDSGYVLKFLDSADSGKYAALAGASSYTNSYTATLQDCNADDAHASVSVAVIGGSDDTYNAATLGGANTFTNVNTFNDAVVAPMIAGPGGAWIGDSTNGNLAILVAASSGAGTVNHLGLTASATGVPIVLNALGTDANIDIDMIPKGTGALKINSLPIYPPVSAYLSGQTSSITDVFTTYGTPIPATPNDGNTHIYSVSGVINIAETSVGSPHFIVHFTDDHNVSRAINCGMNTGSAFTTAPGTTGIFPVLNTTIMCYPNTTITVSQDDNNDGLSYSIAATCQQIK